jgi:hypothetical protein
MEEDTVELYDYFSLIWKRKIFIIVVTLVCIVVGVVVGVMNSRSRLPEIYHAEAVVKIGKKVRLMSTSSISTSLVEYIEDPGLMVQTIPLKHSLIGKEGPEQHLSVTRVGSLAMLRLILEGPDKGVERVLMGLVDMLVDEHSRKANDAVVAYKDYMKTLEADAEMIQETIARTEENIKEMKRREGEYLVEIESKRNEIPEDRDGGDRSAFLNMLYLKTIDKERELNRSWGDLRKIQSQLLMHQITLGNLEEYNTEMVGKIRVAAIEPKRVEMGRSITIGGVAGLIMSLFIAFFMEYIKESKSRRKEKLQRES